MEHKNYAHLIGAITKEVIIRDTTNSKVATLNLIMTRTVKDKEYKDYMPVVVWGELCDKVSNITVGSVVNVEGRIQTRSYDDKNGNRKYVTEVIAEKLTVVSSIGNTTSGNADVPSGSDVSNTDAEDNQESPF